MVTTQYTFRRYEKKYLLTRSQFHEIREALAPYITDDEYGLHTINNIYFDTPDFQMIRHSLTHPTYKERFRLRSYGRTAPASPAYAEICYTERKPDRQHEVYNDGLHCARLSCRP